MIIVINIMATEAPKEDVGKEERIAARRARVLAKIEALTRERLGEEPKKEELVIVDPEKERISWKQQEKSSQRLQKLLEDGTQLVTNVAIASDSVEVCRRREAEEARKARWVLCVNSHKYGNMDNCVRAMY